jgi:DNA mismatch repair protein MutS
LPRVRLFRTAVAEEQGQIIFLRRIEPGAAERSYGIHVARLAGLPQAVSARAETLLREMARVQVISNSGPVVPKPIDRGSSEVERALLGIDLATTTPLEALNHLANLQQRARANQL